MNYLLSEEDRQAIQGLLEKVNRSQSPVRSKKDVDDYVQPSPEVYIAKTPGGGIPALALDVPGSADCVVYQISEFEPPFSLTPFPMGSIRVLNLNITDADGDLWVLVARERSGKWVLTGGAGGGGGGCPTADSIGGLVEFDGTHPGIIIKTWLCPACVTEVYIECWGGSQGIAFSTDSRGGCGGGAYAAGLVTVIPGTTYYLNIDTAATMNSYFSDAAGGGTTFVKAAGGSYSLTTAGGLGGLSSNSLGDITYSGGDGGTTYSGDVVYGGGGGGGAGPDGSGTSGLDATSTVFGSGGTGFSPGGRGLDWDDDSPPLDATTGVQPSGGGGGGGPYPNDVFYSVAGGVGLIRVSWGQSVASLNGQTRGLYVTDNTGQPLEVRGGRSIGLPPLVGSGSPVSGTLGPIYFDVNTPSNIKFWFKKR